MNEIKPTGRTIAITPARKALGMVHGIIETQVRLTGPERDGMRAHTKTISEALDRLDELEAKRGKDGKRGTARAPRKKA
jgi:hypothetical protein